MICDHWEYLGLESSWGFVKCSISSLFNFFYVCQFVCLVIFRHGSLLHFSIPADVHLYDAI